MSAPCYAFKVQYRSFVHSIVTKGTIRNPNSKKEYMSEYFLWDTGATISGVNIDIINKLNLSAVSMTTVETAGGRKECSNYYVDITLPNNVIFPKWPVAGLQLKEGTDVLVGMDIMNQGSFLFAKDKYTGYPFFEFSIPPLHNSHFRPKN